MTEPLRYERDDTDDSVVFHLRNQVFASLRGERETNARVTMWRARAPETLVPPDTGNIMRDTFRNKLADAALRKFGPDYDRSTDEGERRYRELIDDLGRIALMFDRGSDEESERALSTFFAQSGPSRSERLLKYASEANYFSWEEEAYSTVPQDGHKETWPVGSRSFRLWLRYKFYREEKLRLGGLKEPAPLRDQAIADVLKQLEAKALFEGVQQEVFIRVADCGDRVYIDLCDRKWRAIELDASGWRIVRSDELPIKFTRAKGSKPLPEPTHEGATLEPLREHLNLQGEEGERSFRLILGWLVAALAGKGPFPVLVLEGEQGAAKSTAARILRLLTDPSKALVQSLPRSSHDVYVNAVNNWVIALDNIRTLPAWLSDNLCSLSTGGGFAVRTLYSDRDLQVFDAMRPLIVTGISDVATHGDIQNRSLNVTLYSLKGKHKPERSIYRRFFEERPKILGALLNAISAGLLVLPTLGEDGDTSGNPRMADFSTWVRACEDALGLAPGDFAAAYKGSEEAGTLQALEASILSTPLWKLAEAYESSRGGWAGSASEMLVRLSDYVSDDVKRSRDWPGGPNVLGTQLKRIAPLFREHGVIIEAFRESGSGDRRWRVAMADEVGEV